MRFDLNHSFQCREIEYFIKARLYHKLLDLSQYQAVRITGLGVGVASAVLTIASRVGLVFENLLKGILNVAGSPFSKSCSAQKGFKQLFVNTPGHILALPYTLFFASTEIVSKTYSIARSPGMYCADKYSKFSDNNIQLFP